MSRFDATLSLTMILAVLVVIGFFIVRPAPRPAPQPEGAPSETPSPFIGSFPGRETSVSLANGIAAEAWIGAPEHAEDNGLRTSDSTAGAPRQQLAGRGGKPDTTPQPSPRLRTPVPAVGVSVTAAPTRRSVSGQATWYRWRVGQAAAGPRLRAAIGPRWRGTVVTVSTATRTIRTRLTDWCLCGSARVIDLDSRSFRALGPLSRGVLTVRVSW